MTFVIPSCDASQRVNTEAVKFIDVEESAQGLDLLTYVCPICEKQHKGIVYGD